MVTRVDFLIKIKIHMMDLINLIIFFLCFTSPVHLIDYILELSKNCEHYYSFMCFILIKINKKQNGSFNPKFVYTSDLDKLNEFI